MEQEDRMSEIVVRMKVPESCLGCPLHIKCFAFMNWADRVVNERRLEPPKPFDKGCLIICVLPENHGRLVDGDELYTTVKAHDTKRAVNQVRNGVIEEKHICLHDICQAKTIVPAEIVPTIPDPLPIRGVEYVPTEVDARTGIVTYEKRERSET